jgi:hypothetical protein
MLYYSVMYYIFTFIVDKVTNKIACIIFNTAKTKLIRYHEKWHYENDCGWYFIESYFNI